MDAILRSNNNKDFTLGGLSAANCPFFDKILIASDKLKREPILNAYMLTFQHKTKVLGSSTMLKCQNSG